MPDGAPRRTTRPAAAVVTRAAAPAAALAAAAAAVGVVAVVDPNEPGHYPACPFLSLTGWYCPGCGSLRAVHALAHGDVGEAVARNPLAVACVPLLVTLFVLWTRRRLTGRARTWAAPAAWINALLALVIAFWVLRNLEPFAWLAP
jgi:hypothetical protein